MIIIFTLPHLIVFNVIHCIFQKTSCFKILILKIVRKYPKSYWNRIFSYIFLILDSLGFIFRQHRLVSSDDRHLFEVPTGKFWGFDRKIYFYVMKQHKNSAKKRSDREILLQFTWPIISDRSISLDEY